VSAVVTTTAVITDTATVRWSTTAAGLGTAGRAVPAFKEDPVVAVSVKARGKVRVPLRRRLPVDSLGSRVTSAYGASWVCP
jgi:hypothetical protein